MRDLRTVNCAEGQQLESEDMMKRIGDISYRNLGTFAKMSLFDEGKALVVGSGIRVEATTGLTVNVTGGIFYQRFSSSGDVIPVIQEDDQTVTIAAASGAPRTDIIEVQIKTIADKTDYSLVATVATGTSVEITNEEIDRDIKYYLSARKQTNTTTPTAATAGILTGTVAIATTIDLTDTYLLNLSDGEDGSFQEIDCRGAVPAATTKNEIINAINAAVGRTMASAGSGNVIVLTGSGTGQTSYFQIKPPVTDSDADCLETVFGTSSGGTYKYTYTGTNEWVKIAEIDMDAATVTITASEIRNIDQKDTWTGEDDQIIVTEQIFPILDEDDMDTDSATKVCSQQSIKAYVDNKYRNDLFQNAIINPDGAIGQRLTAFTSTTVPANSDDTYLLDRWVLLSDGNDIVDVSQSTDAPDGSQYSMKFLVATANKKFGIVQIIENKNSMPFDDGVVSVSFQAKTTTSKVIENLRCAVLAWSSTADSVTSDVVSAWNAEGANPTFAANWTAENTAANIAITTSWARYTVENIAIDTASMANLALFVWCDDTDAAQNDELFISQIQLNQGAKAIEYQPRLWADELRLCQRYWEKSYDYATAAGTVTNTGAPYILALRNNANEEIGFNFVVSKRLLPVVTLYSVGAGTSGKVTNNGDKTGTATYISQHSVGYIAITSGDANSAVTYHWVADIEL